MVRMRVRARCAHILDRPAGDQRRADKSTAFLHKRPGSGLMLPLESSSLRWKLERNHKETRGTVAVIPNASLLVRSDQ